MVRTPKSELLKLSCILVILLSQPLTTLGLQIEDQLNVVTISGNQEEYRCPPCGCNHDDDLFAHPGECPHCRMTLVRVPENYARILDAKVAPMLKIGHLGMIYTKVIYPVFAFGIILAVFFMIRRSPSNSLNIFLSALILVLSLYGFKNQLFAAAYSPFKNHMGLFVPISFILFIGPLIYFHSKSILSPQFVWRKKYLLHFLPGALMFLYYSTLMLLPTETSWQFVYSRFEVRFSHLEQIAAVISAFSYILYSYLLLRSERKKTGIRSNTRLSRFLIGMSVLLFTWTAMIAINYSLYDFGVATLGYNPLWVLTAIIILWLLLGLITKPQDSPGPDNWKLSSGTTPIVDGAKYLKSGLSQEKSEEILMCLKKYMAAHRVYLDSTLTLDKVSSELKIYKHHISQAINNDAGMNFYSFINEYRIQEATDKLRTLHSDNKTIEAISFECGFSSKSTFNNLFRKKYGVTPSQYLKESVS